MTMILCPEPRKKRVSRKKIDFRDFEWILLPSESSQILKKQVSLFSEKVSGFFQSPLQITAGTPQAGKRLLTLELGAKGIDAQGYELGITAQGVSLCAADEAGAYYGLLTLGQIIEQNSGVVPEMTVSDFPDFANRGVMIDVTRCKVPTMETLRSLIDSLAELKINQVQLYIEHTFAFSDHEMVWSDASPFSSSEIIELDIYCSERFINLVPNFNSFGHFERWLCYPKYHSLAECPKGFEYPWGGRRDTGSVLKPNQTTLKFLDKLYAEYLPNFTSGDFNVGCDETWELGKGWSKKACDKKGVERVYLDFLLKIYELTKKHGRRMMFWGDIILHQPELIKELPKDLIALNWGYEAKHPYSKESASFAAAGVPFYVCPGTSTWNTLTGRTNNCLANLANAARNGMKHGAIGYLNTDWGDGGHHQYLPFSYPGFLAGAAYSWCHKSNSKLDIASALDQYLLKDSSGVLGKVLLELGRVMEFVKARPGNSSIFNHLLFSDLKKNKNILKDVTVPALKKSLARMDELSTEALSADLKTDDANIVKDEVLNGAAMAILGAKKGIATLSKSKNTDTLASEYRRIIAEHERLWLLRNRAGGLRESSTRLRDALDNL